jgi:TRAP-type C4-dicarboxylate transport system substrate-binding protein
LTWRWYALPVEERDEGAVDHLEPGRARLLLAGTPSPAQAAFNRRSPMKPSKVVLLVALAAVGALLSGSFLRTGGWRSGPDASGDGAGQVIVLKGASQFDEGHVFSRTLREFERLVKTYYDKPVRFDLYLNSELGLEKDYFAYMNQGISVDYAIVSPAHMSTFSKSAPLMDMPFLFRDGEHWDRVLDGDALDPIAKEVADRADVVLIGYAGGGVRNLIARRPVMGLEDLEGLDIRVMGAPIQTRIFQAISTSPTVIAYSEVYNAIQTGVIDAAENEAAGLQQMKFYEVGPEISLTRHAITVRPLAFSGKTLRRLPPDLQAAILRAGSEAGAFGRGLESTEDAAILARLEQEGKLRTHPFTGREKLLELARPVQTAYAEEIGAEDVLAGIHAVP